MGRIKKHVVIVIAGTLGSGYFPIAPGTIGAAVAIVGLWFFDMSDWALAGGIVFLFFMGVWASTQAEKIWGADPGRVNIDEVVGMMTGVIFLPKSWTTYAAAFVLFRIFDISKPFPVNRAERLPAGWGIMLDDVIAGIYANVAAQVLFRLLWPHV